MGHKLIIVTKLKEFSLWQSVTTLQKGVDKSQNTEILVLETNDKKWQWPIEQIHFRPPTSYYGDDKF